MRASRLDLAEVDVDRGDVLEPEPAGELAAVRCLPSLPNRGADDVEKLGLSGVEVDHGRGDEEVVGVYFKIDGSAPRAQTGHIETVLDAIRA